VRSVGHVTLKQVRVNFVAVDLMPVGDGFQPTARNWASVVRAVRASYLTFAGGQNADSNSVSAEHPRVS
jgi:hypothetical protein